MATSHFSPFTGECFTDFSLFTVSFRNKKARFVHSHIFTHYRPTGRTSRPLIPLSVLLKFGVAMSIGVYCLTHRAAENARLLSKQIVFCKSLQTHTRTFFNPNRQRPAHSLVLPPRTTSLGPLPTPHQRNRQDPVASFCEDGEHRV